MVNGEGGVLDDESVQRGGQPVLVGLLGRGDRDAVHRTGQRRQHGGDRRAVGGERVAGAGVGELGHRDDVAGADGVDVGLRAARQRDQVVQPLLRARA